MPVGSTNFKKYIHKITAGNDYKKANTHMHTQSHETINIL